MLRCQRERSLSLAMLESDKAGTCQKCLNYQQPDKKLFTNTVGMLVMYEKLVPVHINFTLN